VLLQLLLLLHPQRSSGVGCCAAWLACRSSLVCLQDAQLLQLLL
jgi:hypothetical protein